MRIVASTVVACSFAAATHAGIVTVTITGEVEYNQITFPPFGGNGAGSPVTLTFTLDSHVFTNSPNFPTRGYAIDPASFVLTVGSAVVGLQSPFPAGETAYFVLRNNDPAVDGFFIATSVDFPIGVPLSVSGQFGALENDFSVGYTGDTLSSLDILDALGSYDFTGLTNFNWTINDGPFGPVGIVFGSMTIVPAPGALAALALLGLPRRVTRRRG